MIELLNDFFWHNSTILPQLRTVIQQFNHSTISKLLLTMMILKIIGFAIIGISLFLLATYVVMRLWNWLVPALFNGPRLRFVQALGLFFLARLLFGFGSFGFHGHGGYGHFNHYGYGGPHWHDHHNRVDKHHQQPGRLRPVPQDSDADQQ